MRPQCEEKNWNSGNNLSDIPKIQNAINKDNILVFNFCALNFVSLYHLSPPPHDPLQFPSLFCMCSLNFISMHPFKSVEEALSVFQKRKKR